MQSKKMLVLSYGNFPDGDASSIRLDCLTTLFLEAGYEIFIVSMSRTVPNQWVDYKGKKYISIRSKRNSIIHRIGNVLLYKHKVKRLLGIIGKIDALFLASAPLSSFRCFEKYAKKNAIQLYADRTEWYSSTEFKFGKIHPTYRANITINEKIIDEQWKVISISKLFEDYYNRKGIQTIRIPAIMDTHEIQKWKNYDTSIVKIVYAGSPAKKDSLNLIVDAYKGLSDYHKSRLKLTVIGVTENQYRKTYGDQDNLSFIEFLGRVSRAAVLDRLKSADFTTLMRDNCARFAKAGFPSKVAESFSVGVPMITNLTSDLEFYLKDGYNSLIVDEYSVKAYRNAIERIFNLSKDELEQMHINARYTAELSFDYRNYLAQISKLVEE